MQPGKLITLEGSEGTGKSTNLGYVYDYLAQRGVSVLMTREPGGTALGEAIRALVLSDQVIVPEAELLLLCAARAQHVRHVMEPALAAGHWVVCDRFTEATHAYQGGGRGIHTDIIEYLERWILGDLRPDLTLLLDIPPETGQQRIRNRRSTDRFEREDTGFFERVRARYLERARMSDGRIRLIDAARPLAQVQADIAHHLDEILAA